MIVSNVINSEFSGKESVFKGEEPGKGVVLEQVEAINQIDGHDTSLVRAVVVCFSVWLRRGVTNSNRTRFLGAGRREPDTGHRPDCGQVT